jgi:hypothetical protein
MSSNVKEFLQKVKDVQPKTLVVKVEAFSDGRVIVSHPGGMEKTPQGIATVIDLLSTGIQIMSREHLAKQEAPRIIPALTLNG